MRSRLIKCLILQIIARVKNKQTKYHTYKLQHTQRKRNRLNTNMSTPTLDVRPLTPVLQQKAIVELNEVPERLPADIATLREWLLKQPHLKARTSDQFLVSFLRGCKFSLEKAKRKLDQYYTLRTALPELHQHTFVDDQRLRAIIRLGVTLYLPLPLMDDGPCMVLMRPGKYDPNAFNITDILRASIILQDIFIINNDNAIVGGFMQIGDFEDFGWAHFLQMSPSLMKRFSLYAEEGLPIRIKNSHFFNTGAVFEKLFAVLKLVMPSQMIERFHVHPTFDSLCEAVPIKYLPKDYGGENYSIEEIIARSEQKILEYREYLLDEENYGVDEKLRLGGATNFEALFGQEGSFRKLDVD
ncbi:alpha-tocopherol transfer protein-like isoform X2 [Anastrepha ludens]|uniref:alpha-tocopherol transfer protein-like isoform X2 n=1 Tax=Anastrepha ludens TaxID=28586 RepID=UPI0023B04404|nr:alpha-tocopherol transfer protein-like isoform X2 [Anastrepha ludens]